MPEPTDKTTDAQQRRAESLRKRIKDLATGNAPGDAAKSPREITDEAARQEWLRENGQKPEK